MIWFTSDLHFGHRGVIELAHRPWTYEDQDSEIIKRYNNVVAEGDEVYILGDFSFVGATRTEACFWRLNGRKHLVVGNHDTKATLRLPWESINDIKEIKVNLRRLVLCHYPMLTWHDAQHGAWHLHGHTHGNLRQDVRRTTRLDVGIDTHPEWRPYSYDEVAQFMAQQEYDYVDHHQQRKTALV